MTKTHLVLIIAIAIQIGNAIAPMLPPALSTLVTSILAALALYFHTKDVKMARAGAVAGAAGN